MKKTYMTPALRDLEMFEEDMIAVSLGLNNENVTDESKLLSRGNDLWDDDED